MSNNLSQFIPPDFDIKHPIVVIAGKASYPRLTIDALLAAKLDVCLIAFEDETLPEVLESFSADKVATIKVGQLGKMLKAINKFNAGYAIMVGQITPGRLFKNLHPDLKAIRLINSLKERNAETIFGAIANEIEAIDVKMLDARAFLDSEMAEPGSMTGKKINANDAFISHGINIAKEVSRLDIGQSVVVRKGTVLAVEAFEGTDEMLRRAGSFKTNNLIFVKTSKPNQDYRFDVPVFGINTLEEMNNAGISLACLEAGSVLILEKEKVLNQAKKWGIKIFGYTVSQ